MAKVIFRQPSFFFPKQQEIYDCKSQYTYVMASNKCGKTLSMACWLSSLAFCDEMGGLYCWLSPFAETSNTGFETVRDLIIDTPLYKHLESTNDKKKFRFIKSSPQRIIYPSGSTIIFIQGRNVDGIFGKKYKASVVDEASRLSDKIENGNLICPAWEALKSTMLTTQGQVKLISNPTTKNNWFYKAWTKAKNGEDSRASAFHMNALDSIEAGFIKVEDMEYARANESPSCFLRTWLGEVPDSETEVFNSSEVYNCVDENIKNDLSKISVIGVDLGFTDNEKSDWTVVCGLNKVGELVFFKRFKAEGDELVNKLKAYINNRPAFIDASCGGGHTIYKMLSKECKNLEPIKFNNANKGDIIQTLVHYIKTKKITYPNNMLLITELLNYECEMNSNGKFIYSNGKGARHDDSVIALGLAVLKYKEKEDNGDDYTFNVYTMNDETNIDWDGQGQSLDFSFNLR